MSMGIGNYTTVRPYDPVNVIIAIRATHPIASAQVGCAPKKITPPQENRGGVFS